MNFSEWKEVKLGDVCTIRRGSSPRPIKDYLSSSGMPWVKIADATVGNLSYVSYEKISFAIKNVGLFKTSEKKEYAEFIFLYLKSNQMKDYVNSRLAGSTQKYISLSELRKIPILIPDDKNIATFKAAVKVIFEKIYLKTQENQRLIAIRDSLLPKLMSGEIMIPLSQQS